MPAAEVELLVEDLRAELTVEADTPDARACAAQFGTLLQRFVQDWRQLCALHGMHGQALPAFQRLAGTTYEAVRPLAAGLVMRTNGASALLVLEKRVLMHLVAPDLAAQANAGSRSRG
jgi:hypothetical protein